MKTRNYICPLVEVAIITEKLMNTATNSNDKQLKPGGGEYDTSAPARKLYV